MVEQWNKSGTEKNLEQEKSGITFPDLEKLFYMPFYYPYKFKKLTLLP